MLRIRRKQMAAFAVHMRRQFEARVVAHVRRFLRRECAALGTEGVRDGVRYGIERAEAHGLAIERDVCRYVDLTFVFGRDFDTAPEHGWARAILDDEKFEGQPSARMQHLWDEGKLRQARARGAGALLAPESPDG